MLVPAVLGIWMKRQPAALIQAGKGCGCAPSIFASRNFLEVLQRMEETAFLPNLPIERVKDEGWLGLAGTAIKDRNE